MNRRSHIGVERCLMIELRFQNNSLGNNMNRRIADLSSMAFPVIMNNKGHFYQNFLVVRGHRIIESHDNFRNSQFENVMENKTDDLSSRTDLGNYISILFSTSDPPRNNRLQGTPNRANARPGAHEAGRYVQHSRF